MKPNGTIAAALLAALCGSVTAAHPARSENAGASGAAPLPFQIEAVGISGNPAATNATVGTGWLGRQLGLDKYGVRLGGLWIGGGNDLMSGGVDPGISGYSSLVIDLFVDLERFAGLKGSSIGADFAQFNADPVNAEAGSVLGHIGIVSAPPYNRSELSELWWRQELFNEHLIVRVGKSNAAIDFQNVERPVTSTNPERNIGTVTSLLYGPAVVLPMLYDLLPSYYETAYGITSTWVPNDQLYVSYGVYDGNKARGVSTGLRGPEFNGYYFHIAEAGVNWLLGEEAKPGSLSVGGWRQTGRLSTSDGLIEEDGAQGLYLVGSQQLWYRDPQPVNNAGVSAYVQFGWTDSKTLDFGTYAGAGLTGRGLIPGRPKDSFGAGVAVGWLNENVFEADNELVWQAYYQAHVAGQVYTQTALSYIPRPAAEPGLDAAWAVTQQLVVPF